jgi:pilus assembly protein TadC
MTNSIMFFVGLGIVVVYTFFLIGIISKQNKAAKKDTPTAVDDVLDMDGMGNQGRVPTKAAKNRA